MDKNKMQKIEEAAAKATAQAEKLDILDVLLDENNKEPIVLVDGEGKKLSFEQIAVIPYNDKVYCVLKPIVVLQISQTCFKVISWATI